MAPVTECDAFCEWDRATYRLDDPDRDDMVAGFRLSRCHDGMCEFMLVHMDFLVVAMDLKASMVVLQ